MRVNSKVTHIRASPHVRSFDEYVVVDWSANSKPKFGKDSIWIALAPGIDSLHVRTENVATRDQATRRVSDLLIRACAAGERVLVGFDFPFGFPAGFANAAKHGRAACAPWRATWEVLAQRIRDDEMNRSNRFEVAVALNEACGFESGPFWNCPDSAQSRWLRRTGPRWDVIPLKRLRHTENRLMSRKLRVHEVWKLFTSGSVGSQTLVGVPRLIALRDTQPLRPHSVVWPFETGFTLDHLVDRRPLVVLAEIWPGILPTAYDGRVRDEVQVSDLCRHLADCDASGTLPGLFSQPAGLAREAIEECVSEEGWILGA